MLPPPLKAQSARPHKQPRDVCRSCTPSGSVDPSLTARSLCQCPRSLPLQESTHYYASPAAWGRMSVLRVFTPCTAHLSISHCQVSMWTPNITTPVVKMLSHRGPVNAVAFDPSGHYMASAAEEERTRLALGSGVCSTAWRPHISELHLALAG
eukprot:1161046-Pelagomonas_calceolata.AAC.7